VLSLVYPLSLAWLLQPLRTKSSGDI